MTQLIKVPFATERAHLYNSWGIPVGITRQDIIEAIEMLSGRGVQVAYDEWIGRLVLRHEDD